MQVCHITSVHPRYDIRIFIKECQALVGQHQVNLIVADGKGNEQSQGVQIYDVGAAPRSRLQRMRQTSLAIYRQVLALKPQVVHFHDPELIGIGRRLTKQGFKVIYDVHEDVPKQVMNKHWIPRWLRPLVSGYVAFREQQAASELSGVICATEIIADRFRPAQPRTIAIHNYPILAELAEEQMAWSEREDRLCYIGSIAATRGVLPLCNSLALSRLPLELAGPFSDAQIEQELKQAPGYSFVTYHGVLGRDQVAKLLAKVRYGLVTLLPTPSYLESLPIKLFEYMLAGIPVIASDFPLWRPIVQGHNCGLLVEPADPQAIANAAIWLQQHPQEAEQMGKNGRQAVLAHYTWDREKEKLRKFYQELK